MLKIFITCNVTCLPKKYCNICGESFYHRIRNSSSPNSRKIKVTQKINNLSFGGGGGLSIDDDINYFLCLLHKYR